MLRDFADDRADCSADDEPHDDAPDGALHHAAARFLIRFLLLGGERPHRRNFTTDSSMGIDFLLNYFRIM